MDILIVDDHALFRAGLKQLLLDAHADWRIDESGDGLDAVQLAGKHTYDLVLLDINLPSKNGIDVLKQLLRRQSDLPVLMLSMYGEDQYAVRALKAGAAGYLTKESAPENLLTAIDRAVGGKKYISEGMADRLASQLGKEGDNEPHQLLSDRELEILIRIATGNSVSSIAAELNLSVKTISTYRARILKKMRMKHNAELTYYAVKRGLVS